MRQPDAEIGLRRHAEEGADAVVEFQERDQRHLQRHDQQADDDGDQQSPAGKAHPGQRIGGEGRDQDRDDGRRNGDGQRVHEGAADAFRKQHRPVVVGGEFRRRRRGIIDALAAIALEGFWRGHDEGAVGVELQGHAVAEIGGRAGRILRRRGRLDAEGADVAGSTLTEDVAGKHELAVLLDLRRGRRQSAGFGLAGAGERVPPAGGDDLVLVAQRRDEDAERRHGPDRHEDEHRDVDAEAAGKGLSGCDGHLSALPSLCSPGGCSRP